MYVLRDDAIIMLPLDLNCKTDDTISAFESIQKLMW